ncbi:MAG: TetR/AcrR family transcriptional regulator [Novosphingobium sp.]
MPAHPVAESSETGPRARIFAAAESLVAERGFETVSTRDIVARAGVNVAAVNYHYGSKAQLLLDIFQTRAVELNRERAALLKAAVAHDPGDARGILRALVEPPTLWTSPERQIALRYLNRARSEGPEEIREIIQQDTRHLRRFVDALAVALPAMSREEVLWRFHFALGVLHHNRPSDYDRLALLSDGECDPEDREALLTRLIDFIAAGFGV